MKKKVVDEVAIIEARKEYYKNWRAKNSDKVKQYNRRYWERKAAARAASIQAGEENGDR